MEIKKVGVIGAGTMGRGIAQVFALYGYHVILVDREDDILKKALEKIKERTDLQMMDKISGNIELTAVMENVSDCDLVIEAVFENMAVKKGVFKSLDRICKSGAILATNTSSISINELGKSLNNPAMFIGMHFMNPPKVMRLVEIIQGKETSEEAVKVIAGLVRTIGKMPAIVNDSPGFISNRLLFALIGEALKLFESGVAQKEDIDTVMKYGMNHPIGPIELADFIGLDVCHEIMLNIYENLKDDRYKPPAILESLVREGKLGKKTQEGFYKY